MTRFKKEKIKQTLGSLSLMREIEKEFTKQKKNNLKENTKNADEAKKKNQDKGKPFTCEDYNKILNKHHKYTHISTVAARHTICKRTLEFHYKKWCDSGKDENFSFEDKRYKPSTALPAKTEAEIAVEVVKAYERNESLSRIKIQDLAQSAYNMLSIEDRGRNKFIASNSWLRDFEDRNGLSLQRASSHPSNNHTPKTEADIAAAEKFEEQITKDFEDYPHECIYNSDETGFHGVTGSRYVVAPKGAKNQPVAANCTKGTKISVALIANAAGELLDPLIIVKGGGKNGNSDRCLEKYGDHTKDLIFLKGEKSAYMTIKHMPKLLETINKHSGGKKCLLIMDNLSAHTNPDVIEQAEKLNITMRFLPPRTTSKYQPLDVGIIGPVKQKRNKIVLDNGWNEEEHKENFHVNQIQSIREAMHGIKPKTVVSAFAKSYPWIKNLHQ